MKSYTLDSQEAGWYDGKDASYLDLLNRSLAWRFRSVEETTEILHPSGFVVMAFVKEGDEYKD
jgi:hypothetical protein